MGHPLSAYPLAKTAEVDEAQAVLTRELSDLRIQSVRDRRRFRFEMNGVRLGRTMLVFNQFATSTQVDAGIIENAVIASFCIGAPTVLELDGESVSPDRLGIVSPSRRLVVHRAAGSGVLVLRASLREIEERFRETTGRVPPGPIVFERSVRQEQGVGARIRRLLSYIIDDAGTIDSVLTCDVLRARLDDMLLDAILTLPGNHSKLLHADRRVPAASPLVRRAEAYLDAYAMKPITISDVIAECGCSRSTLFAAFRRHRDYTPLQFLEEARLGAAHDMLRNPSPTDTVTSVALACGFLHLGRFAAAYRRRFGENPSGTLRHAQMRS